MQVKVETTIEASGWRELALADLAAKAADAALGHLRLTGPWELGLLGCDDARIATLNGTFRGKPAATNVLSWPSVDRSAMTDGEAPARPDPADRFLGDIAIAHETCRREADDAGIALRAHVTHLLVHAGLHLLGYDHLRPRDADLMEGLEVEILAAMGFPDPYSR